MDALKKAFRWDEERFGREYDLDAFMIFCADDFNMGAMENKGLNIFNSRLVLADPATATDDDYAAIEAVIGHEYFHNWTGNRVTCRDWFQLSLKEGLTVFRDQEFSSDLDVARGRAHRRGRVPAPRAVPRGRGADGAQRASGRVPRDQQLLHEHGVREGRRGDPHAAHAARLRALPPRHGPVLRASRRHGRDLRRLRAGDAGCVGRRPRAVPALVCAGGHAGGRRCAARYDAATSHLHARARAAHAADARATREAAAPHPVRRRPASTATAATFRCGSPARPRRSARRACSSCASRRQTFRFAGIARAAGAVAAARLLGAGDGRLSPTPTTSSRSSPRTTATPSTRWDAAQRCYANAMLALARDHRDGRPLDAARLRWRASSRRCWPTA